LRSRDADAYLPGVKTITFPALESPFTIGIPLDQDWRVILIETGESP